MELHFCSILASPCMELHSVKKFKLSNFDKNFMPFYILVIFMFLMLCAESVAAKPAEEVINWHIHSDFSVHDLISDGKEQVRIKECVNNGNDVVLCSYLEYGPTDGVYTAYGDTKLDEFTTIYIKYFREVCRKMDISLCKDWWQKEVYESDFRIKYVLPLIKEL
jgi:hypothetical protein|tara:strand:- start:36 stop:527 length:492 start_codon:yes stop_codon:yes gene_type:complete